MSVEIQSDFPQIKNLRWITADIVVIKVVLESRSLSAAGLPPKECEMLDDFYLDLSKLAGFRAWYEDGSDEPHPTDICIDFEGISMGVFRIKKEQILEAWKFNKNYHKK